MGTHGFVCRYGERVGDSYQFHSVLVITGLCDEGMMPEPAGRNNRSPGRKSWVGVIRWNESGRTAQEPPTHSSASSGLCSAGVPSLKGLGDLITRLPSTHVLG
jgi:hypothetical protein